MKFQLPGHTPTDYQPCRYGGAKIAFRGPSKRLNDDYIAFLGGTDTFGPFIDKPFPDLVEHQTGVTCVNLACRKGGIDAYLSAPGLIDLCSAAVATVVQITGTQNMSNRFYTVDPRRNNRFLRASKVMKMLIPDIDYASIQTTDQLIQTVAREAPDRLGMLRQEMQSAWVARMRRLLRAIDGPTVLLWAAQHAPHSAGTKGTSCREPLFVNRAMLTAVAANSDHLVEVVITPDELEAGFKELTLGPADHAAAAERLGPVAHRRIAAAISDLLQTKVAPAACGTANLFQQVAKD